ncbi:ParA family protein, partial [uncultured Parasutterella sp.]|uniref:ParA family protein n=1 Tax=uncultured Parasutterella sp. TaxID=1263098 RepID=UPI0025B51EC6
MINSGLCVPTDTTAGLIMKNGGLVKAEEPFMVIPGDDNLLELESMRDAAGITQNLYSALDAVSDNFDLCIIDCSPSADVRQLIALSLSTHYLIPFQVKS